MSNYTWKGHLKVQERLQNLVPCVWRVSQLWCDRSSCRPYSHKHTEAAFINTPHHHHLLPPHPPQKRRKNRMEPGLWSQVAVAGIFLA